MILIALAIRLVAMTFLLDEQLNPERDHWRFGYETGRIARSIAEGHGFSSPLFEETGPTAWMTPVYPYLVAGVFKVFGIYTKASAIVLVSLNALFASLVCIPLFLIARRSFGDRIAAWSGWTWVFFPYAIYFPVERIWETWLATLLLALLFLITLNLEEDNRLSTWICWGFLWGLEALTSPSALAVLPFLAFWIIYRRVRSRRSWLVPNVLAGVVFLAIVTPWFIRNYEVFHRFIPFRDNMGLVLRLGTKGPTSYWAQSELGPWKVQSEWNEFKQLGELGYMDKEKRQGIEAIRADPKWYAWRTFRRAVFIWTGYWSLDHDYLVQEPLDPPNIVFCTALTILAIVGLWRAWRWDWTAALPYFLMLLLFPPIYYITTPEHYYRRPIDPFFVILAVVALMPKALAKKKVSQVPG